MVAVSRWVAEPSITLIARDRGSSNPRLIMHGGGHAGMGGSTSHSTCAHRLLRPCSGRGDAQADMVREIAQGVIAHVHAPMAWPRMHGGNGPCNGVVLRGVRSGTRKEGAGDE